jgi:hypothetical protein
VASNNRMQRSGITIKCTRPTVTPVCGISAHAPKVRRAVADAGRWATLPYLCRSR